MLTKLSLFIQVHQHNKTILEYRDKDQMLPLFNLNSSRAEEIAYDIYTLMVEVGRERHLTADRDSIHETYSQAISALRQYTLSYGIGIWLAGTRVYFIGCNVEFNCLLPSV